MRLLLLLILFIPFVSSAQFRNNLPYQGNDSSLVRVKGGFIAEGGLLLGINDPGAEPLDYYDGMSGRPVAIGFNSGKVTYRYNGANFTVINNSDTAAKWLTSLYRRNDSVFYVKGGVHTFAYKDSVGAGGGSGTVESFSFSDANGFDGTVTNATTTPQLELAVSGDLDGQLLWANSGSLLGVTIGSGLSFNTGTATLSATGGGGIAIGDAVTGGDVGSVLFVDASGELAESGGFKYGAGGLDLGENGVSQGAVNFSGSTSGTIKITTAAAAGSYTAELPTNAGTEGQVITKGSGNAWVWGAPGGISMGYSLFADTLKSGSTVLSITNRAQINEEFNSALSSTGGSSSFYDGSAGTGADAAPINKTLVGNQGGVAQLTTGTTNTGAGYLASSTFMPIDTNNYYRWGAYNVRLEDLSDGTETFMVRMGFLLGETVQNEIYFKYTHSLNSGNWTVYSENASAAENTNTSVAVVADTDYDLEFEFYEGTVRFWINGALVATHTAQVPQHGQNQGIPGPYAAIIKSAGTTARVLTIDAIKIRVENENAVQN